MTSKSGVTHPLSSWKEVIYVGFHMSGIIVAMRSYGIVFLLVAIVCIQARAGDEFEGLNCRGDIPKAMIGKHSPNKRVVVTERLHNNLGLKDVGAIEISDRQFLVSWLICGKEYAELIDTQKRLVLDVLPVPAHSLQSPESFIEECRVGGNKFPDAVIAILDNSQGQKPKGYFDQIMLPVRVAWKIDEHRGRFVPMTTNGLSCAFSGSSKDVKQSGSE